MYIILDVVCLLDPSHLLEHRELRAACGFAETVELRGSVLEENRRRVELDDLASVKKHDLFRTTVRKELDEL